MANRFLPPGFPIPNFNMNPMDYAKAGSNWLANQWADVATQAELQAQRAGQYLRQQKADAKAMAEAIKKEAKEGLDTIYGKQVKGYNKGPKVSQPIKATPQVNQFKFNQLSPIEKATKVLSTPITKGSIGQIAGRVAPVLSSAGRILGPAVDSGITAYNILKGNYDKGQMAGHIAGSILGDIGYAWKSNPALILSGLGLHGATALNKNYRETVEKFDPVKLARGDYAPRDKEGNMLPGRTNKYGGQLTTGILKNPEYHKALEEGGINALYDLLYPNGIEVDETTSDTEGQGDYSWLLNNNSDKAPTTLPKLPKFLTSDKLGYHLSKDGKEGDVNTPKDNLTPVNEAPASSNEDILNFISKVRSNPVYQEENGLWDNILGYGTSDMVRALDTTPVKEQTQVQDPIVKGIEEQLGLINKQLEDAGKAKRDPVRDAWIANYFGMSPTSIFGYPQSETDRLINLQKSLANQLTIYDKLTSAVQDKEDRNAMREALGKSGMDQMGLALLMNDKTAGPYVTNVLSKYLTKDLEDEKFLRELQKITLTQNLVGENQMGMARQYGINNLLNTEASGINARDLAILNKYFDLQKESYTQGEQNRRADANKLFDLMMYQKGYKGRGTTSNEMTPYQQAQVFLKMAELDYDNADTYYAMAQQLIPGFGSTNSNPKSTNVKSISNLYN